MTDVGPSRSGAAAPYAEAGPAAEAAAPPARGANFIARTITAIAWMLPYALVALVLRLVMARTFFAAGQSKVDGPIVPVAIQEWTIATVTLPMTVKEATYQMFDRFPALPLPSWFAAPVVSYAEFILPICLVLGLATRFAAIALLIMTVVIQVYAVPGALWSLHVYWIAILLVLISLGPGPISVDRMIRYFYEK